MGNSIACIGIIGKQNNLLNMTLFQPHLSSQVEFSLILNSSLDMFDLKRRQTAVDQDLGLLHALDEKFAVYGWLTNTGIKLLIILDTEAEAPTTLPERKKPTSLVGLRDSDLKPAFRALQTAFVKLLQNPFYNADDTAIDTLQWPVTKTMGITNRQFLDEIHRIGEQWTPGMSSI